MDIETVLLTDDERDIRAVAKLSLSAIGGWEVLEAASGSECLQVLRSRTPDLILLDVMMPGMDGLETLDALRAQGCPTRILHVEDDPDVVEVVHRHLGEGIELERAGSLGATLDRLQRAPTPHLVLLDVGLPDGSGLDLLPLLHQRGIPVVIFAAREVGPKASRTASASFTKGRISGRDLARALQDVLSESRHRTPAPTPAT